MTPQEYNRIKEAEKERLRAIRELKQTLGTLRRRKRLGKALGEIAGARDALDDNQALLDTLTVETARHEARLELALDAADTEDDPETPEEARQRRARDLLRQLKEELSEAETKHEREGSASDASADATTPPTEAPSADDLPDKTIGRMKRSSPPKESKRSSPPQTENEVLSRHVGR